MEFLKFNFEPMTRDFQAFFPEVLLCAGIVAMLFLRVFKTFKGLHMGALALVVTLFALAYSFMQWLDLPELHGLFISPDQGENTTHVVPMFGGLLVFDHFT